MWRTTKFLLLCAWFYSSIEPNLKWIRTSTVKYEFCTFSLHIKYVYIELNSHLYSYFVHINTIDCHRIWICVHCVHKCQIEILRADSFFLYSSFKFQIKNRNKFTFVFGAVDLPLFRHFGCCCKTNQVNRVNSVWLNWNWISASSNLNLTRTYAKSFFSFFLVIYFVTFTEHWMWMCVCVCLTEKKADVGRTLIVNLG